MESRIPEPICTNCECASSYFLLLGLTESATKWTKDPVMQKYVIDHIERIKTGLEYLQKDCKVDARIISDIVSDAKNAVRDANWSIAHDKLDEAYFKIHHKIASECAGYKTPHF